ncbi:hypothetical protein DESA109040_13725 [Deinococcus saxicola]|uniref:nuclear transport factor 2 family protein n=1 Tax=Deinococcus saxicola TaxID=249406 RepID=UPI0039F14E28
MTPKIATISGTPRVAAKPARLAATLAALALAATALAQTAPADTGSTVRNASDRPLPPIVQEWEAAWNSGDGDRMAALFTTDGGYQDFSLGYRFAGRAEIAKFVQESVRNVTGLHVTVTDAFQTNDRVALRFVFSGQVNGAPNTFSVPVLTVMELKGGKIAYDGDYYNRLEVLRQSGLPIK